MKKNNKLALGLLLSVSIMGTVAHALAKDEPAKKVAPAAKTDINTVIDVQGTVARNEVNTRYIDLFGAMRESKEGVEASAKLEVKREELGQSIEAVRSKYESLVNDFKTKAATMNDSARAKKEQEVVKAKRDYDNALQSAEEEMKLVMQQVTEALAKEVELAVAELAKKEGLDAVVDKVTGRVVYASGKADYTDKVVKSMDKHFSYKIAHNEKSAASTVTVASNKKANTTA